MTMAHGNNMTHFPQNSIRHNLSLHFGFTKIARDKSEKGKGGYWELSMNATKSEKKRVRNRRKCRDDGRIFQSHRTRLPPRRSIQRSSSATSTKLSECSNKTKSSPIPMLSITTNDSCNGMHFFDFNAEESVIVTSIYQFISRSVYYHC